MAINISILLFKGVRELSDLIEQFDRNCWSRAKSAYNYSISILNAVAYYEEDLKIT